MRQFGDRGIRRRGVPSVDRAAVTADPLRSGRANGASIARQPIAGNWSAAIGRRHWRGCFRLSTIGRMRSLRVYLIFPVLLLGLSGCGSDDPGVRGDPASAKYKTDLEACRTSSAASVHRHNAGTPGTWMISPITGPSQVRSAVRTCMVGKGYALEKAAD
jgi:hypothetical protein